MSRHVGDKVADGWMSRLRRSYNGEGLARRDAEHASWQEELQRAFDAFSA